MLGPTDKRVGEAIQAALSESTGPVEPFDVFLARVSAEALGEHWEPKPALARVRVVAYERDSAGDRAEGRVTVAGDARDAE